jgi:hypothetical protein
VGPRPRRELQVAPQDRGTVAGTDLLETHGLAAATAEHRMSAGGPNVGDPAHALANIATK